MSERHLIPISGKDSLTAALIQTTRFPRDDYEYFFNDVGAELPETYDWLDRVEQKTGWKIQRIGESLPDIILKHKVLPSPTMRYCTTDTKIRPMKQTFKAMKGDKVFIYYGLRADETQRVGFACLGNASPFNTGEFGKNGSLLGLIRTSEVIFCVPLGKTKIHSIAEIGFYDTNSRFVQFTANGKKFNQIRAFQELYNLGVLELSDASDERIIKNVYHILNFSSIHGGINQSGFSIVLDKKFAEIVRNLKRNGGERLTDTIKTIISESLGKINLEPNAIEWVGDSWLLKSLRIGGNCACFSAGLIDDGAITRHVRFDPHNIDSPIQAATILAVWLYWFNSVAALADFEQPFVS